ncbi:MAG: CBS domain-containing protein [Solirubrobacterales bacterium]
MSETDCPQVSGEASCVDTLPAFFQTGLQVRDVMSKTQLVVSCETPVLTVTQLMLEHRVSLVAVEEAGKMVAVITERELARGAASHGSKLRRMTAADIMTSLPAGILPECPLSQAAQIMRAHRLRWFPVAVNEDVISVLTQADMTRAATLLPELGDVGSIMSTEIITIEAAQPLLDAAKVMSTWDISCVIATHQGKVGGILTEADILRQLAANDCSWSTITVADVMTFPVVSIEPACSLSEARALMDRTHVHRLVVLDRGSACGLITQTDITRALDEKLRDQERQRQIRLADSNDAIFAVELGGTTMYVNSAFTKLFGSFGPETFVGRPFLPVCCWATPADREPFMTAFEGKDLQVQSVHLRTDSARSLPAIIFSTIAKNFRGEVIGRQGIVWPIGASSARNRSHHARIRQPQTTGL